MLCLARNYRFIAFMQVINRYLEDVFFLRIEVALDSLSCYPFSEANKRCRIITSTSLPEARHILTPRSLALRIGPQAPCAREFGPGPCSSGPEARDSKLAAHRLFLVTCQHAKLTYTSIH